MANAQTRGQTARQQLTENRLAHFKPARKRTIIYDAETRELGVKIEPSGSKSYFWFKRVDGKPRWVTIGPCSAVKLADARSEAKKLTAKLNDWRKLNYTGPDPFKGPDRPLAAPTLNTLVEAYCDQHIPKKAIDPEFAAHTVRITAKRCFGEWMEKPLDAISRRDVLAKHAELGKKRGHSAANRSIGLLYRLYRWGIGHSTYDGENPVQLNKEDKFEEHPRTRFLSPEELVRLEAALEKESNPDLRDFIALLLFTGQRKMEVLTARWDQIDLGTARWAVPKERRKNKKPHVVLLSPSALRILSDRKERVKDNVSPWIFPGGTDEGHRGDFGRPWKRVRAEAGLDSDDPTLRVTKHSLRHTNISYLLMAGRSIPEAAAVSGHRAHEMVERYGHLLDETVRQTVAAGENKRHELMEAARKALPGKRGVDK